MLVNEVRPSFLEKVFYNISEYVKFYKVPIVSACFTTLITYMFVFTNKIINWDDLQFLFGKGYTITSGRWALELLEYVLPNYSMPWFWGIISSALLIFSICIIIDIFKIDNKILQGILAAIIIAFPSEIGTMFYMFTSTSYAIAFLLAVLAVRLYLKSGVVWKVLGVICAVFSMGIYQAYITITISFFVLLLIKDLLSNEKDWSSVIKAGIKYVLYLLIIGCLYYGITAVVLDLTGNELNGWAIRATSDSSGLLHKLTRSWKLFATMILLREYGLETTMMSWGSHIAFLTLTGLASIFVVLKKKNVLNFLLYVVLVAVALPLSINFIVVLIGEDGVHGLTLYSFISVYIFAAIVVEIITAEKIKNIFKDSVCVLLCLIVVSNVYVANKSYLKQYMVYENTFSFYQSIVTQIQQTPGFDENSKLVVIGNAEQDSSYLENFGEDKIYGLCGFRGESISDEFITYYLGFDIPFATTEEKATLVKEEYIENMPVYPYNGYVQKVDDYIVVKLGH